MVWNPRIATEEIQAEETAQIGREILDAEMAAEIHEEEAAEEARLEDDIDW